jgi:hypothetical protein
VSLDHDGEADMEPVITTIVAALVAGATAATKDVATQAIKEAHQGLRSLVTRKYAGAGDAVEAIEQEPEADLERKVLAKRLDRGGAADDVELKTAAQALLDAVGDLRGVEAAAPLFDFDRLQVARDANLSDIEALGPVFRGKNVKVGRDFKVKGVRQKTLGGKKRKN